MPTVSTPLRLFYILSGLYFFGITLLVFLFPKGTIELALNTQHNPLWDVFFYYITYLGDGWVAAYLLVMVLLFMNSRAALTSTVVLLFTSLIVQVLKRWIFAGAERPAHFFKTAFYHIPGLELHHFHSFPSGHTAQAFALALALAYYTRSTSLAVLSFVLAVATGWSRVYLMQHFLIDTLVGGIIALFIGFFFWKYIQTTSPSPTAPRWGQSKPLWPY